MTLRHIPATDDRLARVFGHEGIGQIVEREPAGLVKVDAEAIEQFGWVEFRKFFSIEHPADVGPLGNRTRKVATRWGVGRGSWPTRSTASRFGGSGRLLSGCSLGGVLSRLFLGWSARGPLRDSFISRHRFDVAEWYAIDPRQARHFLRS